jgi:hypothetical protein
MFDSVGTYDSTNLYTRERILLTSFPKAFLREKAILHIEYGWIKSTEEMSGLPNWMIEGLTRLLQNGTSTASKTAAQTKLAFNVPAIQL